MIIVKYWFFHAAGNVGFGLLAALSPMINECPLAGEKRTLDEI